MAELWRRQQFARMLFSINISVSAPAQQNKDFLIANNDTYHPINITRDTCYIINYIFKYIVMSI